MKLPDRILAIVLGYLFSTKGKDHRTQLVRNKKSKLFRARK